MTGQKWTVDRIVEELGKSPEASRRNIEILGQSVVDNWLNIDIDGVEISIGISDDQILVSTPLEAVADVPKEAQFIRRLLETQRLLPLSSFAIVSIGDVPHYELIGELSTTSSFENLLEEVVTLASNAKEALEMIVTWKAA